MILYGLVELVNGKLAASTSSGRAGAVGMLQAILQVMLQDPRSWALYLLLDGRFVLRP